MSVTVRNQQRRIKIDAALMKRIARETLALLGTETADLGVVLVDDPRIARLNREFHHTDGPTDVLAFSYQDEPVMGELVISVDRAQAQAWRYRCSTARELVLYLVHGILHLHGYDDRHSRARARMRAAERRLLRRLARLVPWDGLVRLPRGKRPRGRVDREQPLRLG